VSEISRTQFAVYAALVVAVVLIGSRALRDSGTRSAVPASANTAAVRPASAGEGAPQGAADGAGAVSVQRAGGSALVHVAGAVRHPGVYRLGDGARVQDAVRRAGGRASGADLNAINLAARVADGQHVIVPRHGDPAPAESGDGDGSTGDPSAPVSLNGASAAQLEALPHVGPALARAIIDYRERHGGFKSVHELRNIRRLGERVYADLVDRVTL